MRALPHITISLGLALFAFACSEDEAETGRLQQGECLSTDDCDLTELCVQVDNARGLGECFAQCTALTDVCPANGACTEVELDGAAALACLPVTTVTDAAWRTCTDARGCGQGEQCTALGGTLGSRCVPLCDDQNACQDPRQRCAVSVELETGGEFQGCGQRCNSELSCDAGWRCDVQDSSTGEGLCVR